MELSVIISTFNAASFLKKSLIGLAVQSFKDFEVIVADDGTGTETKHIIDAFHKEFKSIRHICHEDQGSRKSKIMNRAIEASKSKYLIFSDANCIPRKDFLQIHQQRREESFFLSGAHFKVSPLITQAIEDHHIINQTCFDLKWLKRLGLKFSLKNQLLSKNKIKANIFNALTPGKAAWNHHNVSCWKKDLLEVNGFDERINHRGGEDELFSRLQNNDIHGIKVNFNAICIHLNDPKMQVQPKEIALNSLIHEATRESNICWTQYGIHKERAIALKHDDYE